MKPANGSERGISPFLFAGWVEALRALLAESRPADQVLHHFFRENPSWGGRDRSLLTEHFYTLLRHWEVVTVLAPVTSARRLVLACLQRVMGRSARDLQALCQSDDERQWLFALPAQRLPEEPAVQALLPNWLLDAVMPVLKEGEWLDLGRALRTPAPLDLRVNTLKTDRDGLLKDLQSAGIELEPTPWSPWGLRVKGRPDLQRLRCFKEGHFEVQDEGSQLLSALVGPRRRDMVVDFCAGAGGKSLHLGALMQNQGRLYAFDVAAHRLDRLKPRLKRAGLSNLMPVVIAHENDDRVRRLHGKIDRVLVDAPCSGTGTLRRNPDLRLRQDMQGLPSLLDKQRGILEGAARLVKPGGRLVYATCSLLPAENHDQARAFTERHPEFECLSAQALLAASGVNCPLEGDVMQLWPQRHGTDGFFAAVWQRRVEATEG